MRGATTDQKQLTPLPSGKHTIPILGFKVMSRLCGENLLENTVILYEPGWSPSVLKSNSFTPSLLSQWNLFPSSLSRRRGKTTLPLVSVVERERLAVLSRMGIPELLCKRR